ncbi:MAG: hypothetical protein J5614_08885, partial [Paludibacteraceae bacterium]|nr:hypothetical protein [Paludibacteraceae bacterium]
MSTTSSASNPANAIPPMQEEEQEYDDDVQSHDYDDGMDIGGVDAYFDHMTGAEREKMRSLLRREDFEHRLQGVQPPSRLVRLEPRDRLRRLYERPALDVPQEDLDAYMSVVNPTKALIQRHTKQAPTLKERKEARDAQRKKLFDAFALKHPTEGLEKLSRRIAGAQQAYNEYRLGPKPKLTKEKREAKQRYNYALREFRKEHPTGIFEKIYGDKVRQFTGEPFA